MSPSCENKDDSYSTTFHPVLSDSRVPIPSHFKHFSVKMFTFIRDEDVLEDQVRAQQMCRVCRTSACLNLQSRPQIYVHCDVVICDVNKMEGICRRQCASPRDSFSYTSQGLRGRKGEHSDISV